MRSEKELIEGCISNDRPCQQELYTRFAPLMMGVCRRYCPRLDEAEDILQEGFVRVFYHLRGFRFQGSLEGWIRRIMVNTALGYLRSLNIRMVVANDQKMPEGSLEAGVIEKLSANEVLSLIAALPTGYRTVFNLHAIEGFNHKEISLMLGINEGTSRSQYLKARLALQEMVKNKHLISNKR
jgi:RNA polymerase sigma factor (sigma-70 family)